MIDTSTFIIGSVVEGNDKGAMILSSDTGGSSAYLLALTDNQALAKLKEIEASKEDKIILR
jgi:hypothetical protein